MFNFFKKKEKSKETKPGQATDKKSLENVEFHAMPQKFTKATGGGVHKTKKWGMAIVISGAVILVAAAAFLIWYIFQPTQPSVINQNQNSSQSNQNSASQNQNENEDAEDSPEEEKGEEDETEEERDFSEQACGETDFFASEILADYENDEVLACLGQRAQNNCLRAAVIINTASMQGIRMAVLGLRQDECLVQLTYPSIDKINDTVFQDYANSYIRCSYDIDNLQALNYSPERLAAYIYEQSTFDQLTEESACEGTAFNLWQERDERDLVETEEFVPGVDSDSDGLSDVEENTIFATSADVQDTDEDGYSDSTEIFNLYNPAGGGLLADSGLVASYNNSSYSYNLLYPKNWRLEDAANGNNVIFFSNLDGFVQVITQSNPQRQALDDWYADVNASQGAQASIETNKNGLQVLYSPDGLTAYLLSSNDLENIYVITYSPEQTNKLEFLATFKMMVSSFSKP